jgi:hypothetical protein
MSASTDDNRFDRLHTAFRERPWFSLIFTVIVVIANVWLDYTYYPLFGTLFDIIVLIALFRSYLNSRFRAERHAKSR